MKELITKTVIFKLPNKAMRYNADACLDHAGRSYRKSAASRRVEVVVGCTGHDTTHAIQLSLKCNTSAMETKDV